jgi:hypothetical protein
MNGKTAWNLLLNIVRKEGARGHTENENWPQAGSY